MAPIDKIWDESPLDRPPKGGPMAKLIIGILLLFVGILAILLLFIISFTAALLVYPRRGKKAEPAAEKQGAG